MLLSVVAVSFCHAAASTGTSGYAELVRQAAPCVVTVMVEEQPESAGQRAADRAAGGAQYNDLRALLHTMLAGVSGGEPASSDHEMSLGSGFLIREDGMIVTNRHVVTGALTVNVKLADGREFAAQVIGADATTDIALLKIPANHLPTLRFKSSEQMSVGDPVIAIGNPFGLGQSVTAGILSARARTLEQDPYIDFLQTDAAINFGNSGGPLLATDGTVVGVTSAILSPSGGSVGLGFAIPAETVIAVVAELEQHGKVSRGYLGIEVQTMTPALARALLGDNAPKGVLITAVDPNGPSAGALLAADVLLSVDSKPVEASDLGKVVVHLQPGVSVLGSVMRNGIVQSVSLLVGQLPDPAPDPLHGGDRDVWVPSLELGVALSTEDIRRALKATDEKGGLIVTQLRPDGAGAMAGLKIGDLLTHVGSTRLESAEQLASVRVPSVSLPLLLRVVRNGAPGYLAITGSGQH